MPLKSSDTVFFSTADDTYVSFAATSLLSIREFLPEAELYILSRELSIESRFMLEANNIKYIELDLSKIFYSTWEYPIECFYIFAGPEIFERKGFKYSVYVDGDTLCQNNPLAALSTIRTIGTAQQTYGLAIDIFGEDWTKLKDMWVMEKDTASRPRVNTGVVYFNNKYTHKIDMLKKIGDLYDRCVTDGVPRKGDDSLFALFQMVYLRHKDILYLPCEYNYTMHHNPVVDPADKLVFLHFTKDKPWKPQPYTHQEQDLKIYDKYTKIWRKKYLSTKPSAWLGLYTSTNQVLKIYDALMMKSSKIFNELMHSSLGLKRNIALRRINRKKNAIKIYLWRSGEVDHHNFGDEVTKDIIGNIFGYRYQLTDIDNCELVAAGSILEIVRDRLGDNNIKVWGSGMMWAHGEVASKNVDVRALRGYVTSARYGLKCATGDPGILANVVYGKSKHKLRKIGLVAHYIDMDLPIVQKIIEDDRFILINPLGSPRQVAKDISACKAIASSSLHGLIFADSYGIPNMHVELSDRVAGGGYKFRDYYSGVGRQYLKLRSRDLLKDDILERIIENYDLPRDTLSIKRSLVKAFPY